MSSWLHPLRLARLRRAGSGQAWRRFSQVIFFLGFSLLFAFASYRVAARVPLDLFLRADPLIALSAMLSLREIIRPLLWYALPVAVLSLLLGRVFCGWICPMGTAIDLGERLFHIRGRHPSQAPPRSAGSGQAWRRVKYYVLIAVLVTALLPAAHRSQSDLALSQTVGLSAAYLMDPIAILTRTFTLAGLPAVESGLVFGRDAATIWQYSDLVTRHPWLARVLNPVELGLNLVTRPDPLPVTFRLGLVAFVMFAAIVALGRLARRFWCRNLCPLGALLGVMGKASPVRLRVSDACTRCLRCVNECKMGAISEDPYQYRGPECIACYSCIAVCPEKAISVTTGRAQTGRNDTLSLERRRVLEAIGVGIAAVVLPKVDWTTRRSESGERVLKISSERLIRPPGALPEDSFVTACVRCGECMKVCATNTLQPALGEGGLEALGTPVIVARIGPCAQECTACGDSCPTRAIAPFTVEEKQYLYVGTASVDRSRCIAWAEDKQCLVCDEACAYDAIYQDTGGRALGGADAPPGRGTRRPMVNERICVGCGQCEWVCPVEPTGAIRVYSSGDKRHLSRAARKAFRESAQSGQAAASGAEAQQEGAAGSPYPVRGAPRR
jgi:polyferredoxin